MGHEDAAHCAEDVGPETVGRLAEAARSVVDEDTETAELLAIILSNGARGGSGSLNGKRDVIVDHGVRQEEADRYERSRGIEAATGHNEDRDLGAGHEDTAHGAGYGGPKSVAIPAGAPCGAMIY